MEEGCGARGPENWFVKGSISSFRCVPLSILKTSNIWSLIIPFRFCSSSEAISANWQVGDDEKGDATVVRIWGAEPDVDEAARLLSKLLARSQVCPLSFFDVIRKSAKRQLMA